MGARPDLGSIAVGERPLQGREQPRDQGLGAGAGQGPFTPELLHEHVERYHPVEMKDEHGQEGPLLGAADLEHPSARSDLEGAE
jgi:hypothetical protein